MQKLEISAGLRWPICAAEIKTLPTCLPDCLPDCLPEDMHMRGEGNMGSPLKHDRDKTRDKLYN